MKPYFAKDGCSIYLGDCREIMPLLDPVDLVLTDPPYGIGQDGGAQRTRGSRRTNGPKIGWDIAPPDGPTFSKILEAAGNHIIWGGNYFTDKLPVNRGWLYWHKYMGGDFSDGELAWTNLDMVLRAYGFSRKNNGRLHPTQKPLELMLWCLGFAPDARSVLDPFMGSGTTLRAAKDLGKQAIGIELHEPYCEIAARRLEQQVFDFEPSGAK